MARLRKLGKSGNYFAYFYDAARTPTEKSVALKTTRKDVARRRITHLEREYEEGTFDPWADPAETDILTVTEAKERFLKEKAATVRPRTLETYRGIIERWEKTLPAGLRMRDVNADHVRPFVYADVARATQRKRYGQLRIFFRWAVRAGHASKSPLEDLPQPKKQQKAAAFLSPNDLERLLQAIEVHMEMKEDVAGRSPDLQWLADMIVVGVCTGLRRGELARLRWQDVDLREGLLTVRSRDGGETKSGHERQLPLAPDALEVLRRRQDERTDASDGPVFVDRRGLPIRLDRISHRFKDMVRVAKLDDRLHFHSLRHTCGSWLAMKGVPMRVIQGILGHSSVQVTERYSHLQPEVMQKAIQETFG